MGGEAAGDLAGAGDSLTVLACLYTAHAASRSALGRLQEMGWFPTSEVRVYLCRLAAEYGPILPQPRSCESHGPIPKPAPYFFATDGGLWRDFFEKHQIP